MSPIVLSKEKEDNNTKTKQSSMSPIVLSKEKRNNNTKTKHEFYVTHCFI